MVQDNNTGILLIIISKKVILVITRLHHGNCTIVKNCVQPISIVRHFTIIKVVNMMEGVFFKQNKFKVMGK